LIHLQVRECYDTAIGVPLKERAQHRIVLLTQGDCLHRRRLEGPHKVHGKQGLAHQRHPQSASLDLNDCDGFAAKVNFMVLCNAVLCSMDNDAVNVARSVIWSAPDRWKFFD